MTSTLRREDRKISLLRELFQISFQQRLYRSVPHCTAECFFEVDDVIGACCRAALLTML